MSSAQRAQPSAPSTTSERSWRGEPMGAASSERSVGSSRRRTSCGSCEMRPTQPAPSAAASRVTESVHSRLMGSLEGPKASVSPDGESTGAGRLGASPGEAAGEAAGGAARSQPAKSNRAKRSGRIVTARLPERAPARAPRAAVGPPPPPCVAGAEPGRGPSGTRRPSHRAAVDSGAPCRTWPWQAAPLR